MNLSHVVHSSRVRSIRAIRILAPFTVAALAALAGCSSASPPSEEATSTERQDLYGLGSLAQAWPSGQVPVCYANPNHHPELQALIPTQLAQTWGRAANINFTGFGACPSAGGRVTIVFSDQAGYRSNTDNLGYGNRTITLLTDDTSANNSWFKFVVTHEMGHALGFAHEMKRPDNWPGGVAKQCGGTPNDYAQYAPVPGGITLTSSYDSSSIMNYCGPNVPQLSVGDVLGASSPSAYGPQNACTFRSGATMCTWKNGLHAESTYTVPQGCPSVNDAWVLQVNNGGAWSNVPNSCPSGGQVGTCGTATSASSFTLGWQTEGGVGSGPAIGSSQQVRMCDSFGNCGAPFSLSVTDCQTKADQLYLSPGNDPFLTTQGGVIVANVLMYGPWVQVDGGYNATAWVTSNPIPGATYSFMPGTTINGAGALQWTVSVPLSTPVGTYSVGVSAHDNAAQVTRSANLAVQVLACTPWPKADVCSGVTATACGVKSSGCGLTTDCGTCAAGSACSSGFCCATGTHFEESSCVSDNPPPPPVCPPTKPYCELTGFCSLPSLCKSHCTGTHCF